MAHIPKEEQQNSKHILLWPSRFISWLFHPVLMPPLLMLLFYYIFPTTFAGVSQKDFFKLLLIVALNTTVFSVLFVLVCKGLGLVKTIHIHDAKERIIPLIGVMVFFFWCNHVLGNIQGVPFILRLIVLGSFWGVIVLFLVNIFFKVSLHTAGAGGALALFIILLFTSRVNMLIPLVLSIIVAGLIGTARLIAGRHKMSEIWVGYFTGFAAQLAAYFYLT